MLHENVKKGYDGRLVTLCNIKFDLIINFNKVSLNRTNSYSIRRWWCQDFQRRWEFHCRWAYIHVYSDHSTSTHTRRQLCMVASENSRTCSNMQWWWWNKNLAIQGWTFIENVKNVSYMVHTHKAVIVNMYT